MSEEPSAEVTNSPSQTFTLYDPLYRRCPRCGSPNGFACRTRKRDDPQWRGPERKPHAARLALIPQAGNAHSASGPSTGQQHG